MRLPQDAVSSVHKRSPSHDFAAQVVHPLVVLRDWDVALHESNRERRTLLHDVDNDPVFALDKRAPYCLGADLLGRPATLGRRAADRALERSPRRKHVWNVLDGRDEAPSRRRASYCRKKCSRNCDDSDFRFHD